MISLVPVTGGEFMERRPPLNASGLKRCSCRTQTRGVAWHPEGNAACFLIAATEALRCSRQRSPHTYVATEQACSHQCVKPGHMQGYSEEEIEAVLQPLRQSVLHAPDRASLALTRAEEFPDTRLRQRCPPNIPPELLWGLRQGAARLFKVCMAPYQSGFSMPLPPLSYAPEHIALAAAALGAITRVCRAVFRHSSALFLYP